MLDEEHAWHQALAQVDAVHAPGARNLVHYMALRRHDRRVLQEQLGIRGLSLDADPTHVLHRVECMVSLLRRVDLPITPGASGPILDDRTVDLLGPAPPGRRTRIMVTLGAESAAAPGSVRDLVAAGVDCVRLNCARDDRDAWQTLVNDVRDAAKELGRSCRIFMDMAGAKLRVTEVIPAAGKKGPARVKTGDCLAVFSAGGNPPAVAGKTTVAVTAGRELRGTKTGDMVWFDDGKIGGEVTDVVNGVLMLTVRHVKQGGATLRAERSVNMPGSTLMLPLLTQKDEEDLLFARSRADMVGLSFVTHPETIARAAAILGTSDGPGVVVKVENLEAVQRMPMLLLELMKRRRVGVLLARGDLAVECGYERLVELQDEIVALSEAAGLPLFWATEVLDTFIRKRRLTRPEITDVAAAARAECVMLNRGSDLMAGVRLLDRLLCRHNARTYKGRHLMGPSPMAADRPTI